MPDLLFFFLFFIIYLDLRLLREYNPSVFKEIFCSSKEIIIFFLFLLALILFFAAEKSSNLFLFVLISFFPWYLLKRDRFIQLSSLGREKSPLSWYEDALGVILWWFFAVFTIVFILKKVGPIFFSFDSDLMPLMLITFLSLLIMVTLIYRASKKFPGKDFLTNISVRREGRPLGQIILIPALIGLVFACLSANIIVTRQNQPATPLSEILESTQSFPAILLFIILAVLFAPLLEEIIFRGYFYYVLSQRRGSVFAILLIALSFGLLHVDQYWGDWLAVGMVMLLGLVLTLLRSWTGSTLSSIAAHYAYNAGVMIMTIILFALTNPSYVEYKMNAESSDFVTQERLLLESMRIKPEFADAINDLAALYARENVNLGKALRLVDQALKLHPDHYAYLDTKAEILHKMGDDGQALSIRRNLLKKKISKRMKEYQNQKIEAINGSGFGEWTPK